MKFPVTIRHRSAKAKIYAPSKNFPYYRLAYTDCGKRRMQTFGTYSEARERGKKLVKEAAKGSQAGSLTAGQSRDAIAALQRLESLRIATGRRVSLLAAVSEFAENIAKLPDGRTLGQTVDEWKASVASVRRKDLKTAVEDFITNDEPRTKAKDGERAQLSAKYTYNRAIMLRRFADTFPNLAVCDLTKDQVDQFFRSELLKGFSAKSRNHHRASIRQLLEWCVRKDYLPAQHRIGEADQMRREQANTSDVDFYSPEELGALLATAQESMRAMVAIGGLAGLRTAELLRLDWRDVWRVPGHIEVTAGKSKTRSRRLVEICPALAVWLEPFRKQKTGKICELHEITFQQHFVKLCQGSLVGAKGQETPVPRRPNGLRHAFCTYHFALHANENLTAAQAGNTPAMVHKHYKGLATKAEAEAWFGVAPAVPENVVHLNQATAEKRP